jgi:hypothetical protein
MFRVQADSEEQTLKVNLELLRCRWIKRLAKVTLYVLLWKRNITACSF